MEADETICPECAETIKQAARVCKHCGYRLSTASEPVDINESGTVVSSVNVHGHGLSKPLLVWAALIIVLIGLAIGGWSLLRTAMTTPIKYASEDEAKRYISNLLTDPSSAQFRIIVANERCVSGEVNARNRMGGYVGYQDFFYSPLQKRGLIDPVRVDLVNSSADEYAAYSADHLKFLTEVGSCGA